MCILFFNARVAPRLSGEFSLVLINNRDELYHRPTLYSDYWKECPDIISGRDAMPGKEGGTWLGISKKGKIGVLLNVLQPLDKENALAKGRGSLVSNFLTSSKTSKDYINTIMKERDLYNEFNLVTIETGSPFPNFVIGHYNNLTGNGPIFFQSGVHGMGNCLPETPWRKISYGKEKFTEICDKYPKVELKDKLVESLFELLNDDTRHFPDPQLEKQGRGKEQMLPKLSALNVKIPEMAYGTRTNTIILIDELGNVDYIERTMSEPINPSNPQWITNNHRFLLDLEV